MSDAEHAADTDALLRNAGWLRGLALQLVGDASAADDVVQETWLKALTSPPRETSDGPRLRAWLSRVARNAASMRGRSERRRQSREAAVARSESSPSAAETAAQLEAHRRLLEAVDDLEEPYRTAVRMRWFDGLPPREIAAQLGVSPQVVWTRLSRAHAQLRARLEERDGGRRGMLLALMPLVGSDRVAAALGVATTTAAATTAGMGVAVGTGTKIAAGAVAACLVAGFFLYDGEPGVAPQPEQGAAAEGPTDDGARRLTEPADSTPDRTASADDVADTATEVAIDRAVSISIVDALTGEPVPDAQVRFGYRDLASFTGYELSGAAGENGVSGRWVSFDLRETRYPRSMLRGRDAFLTVDAGSYALHVTDLIRLPAGDGAIDLGEVALSRGLSVSGRVVSGRTGNPLPGAQLFVTPPAPRGRSAALQAGARAGTSDADGNFELDRPVLGCERHQVVVAYALTDEGLGVRSLFLRGDADVDDVEIVVTSAPLTVAVVDALGDVVDGAWVRAHFRSGPLGAGPLIGDTVWPGPHMGVQELIEAQTGADGVARMDRFPVVGVTTRIDVVATARGHASTVASNLEFGEDGLELRLQLRGAGERAITGRVVDEAGHAVAEAEVRLLDHSGELRGPTTRSGTDGSFRLTGFTVRGPQQIEALADASRTGRASVDVLADGEIDAGEVVVRATAPITGRVVDGDGKPLHLATLRAFVHGEHRTAMSDEDGRFVIEDVHPGEWNLRAEWWQQGESMRRSVQVVHAGADIVVELPAPPVGTAKVLIEVVDSATGVAVDARVDDVMMIGGPESVGSMGVTITMRWGRATVENVAVGRWHAWVRAGDYVPAFAVVDVEPGVDEVRARVTLGTGATMEGAVDTSAVENFRNTIVIAQPVGQRGLPGGSKWWHRPPHGHTRTTATIEDGRFSLDRLPAGTWELRLLGPGFVGSATVELTDGATTPVVIRAQSGAIVNFVGDAFVDPGIADIELTREVGGLRWSTGSTGKPGEPFDAVATIHPGKWRWVARFPTDRGDCLTHAAETQEGEFEVAPGERLTIDVSVIER